MERERFDGADIAHLLLSCGATLDWKRLLRRFGPHWRVLLSHLVLFGFAFPEDARAHPALGDGDAGASPGERGGLSDAPVDVCRGTLLSREQYLPDLARAGATLACLPKAR